MSELDLHFSKATPADQPRVLQLLRDRAEWIRAKGSTQWAIFLTDEGERLVNRLIVSKRTWIVTSNGQMVGTFRIDWTDERFWGAKGLDGLAGYVHTLATDRAFAGQRLGARIMRFACEQIVTEGRTLLRIDCAANNPKLIAYYRSLGFQPRETVPAEGFDPDYRAQQLERPASLSFA